MKGPFTEPELAIISDMNDADLGEIVEKLTPLELIRLKTGEGISLKMIMKGKALLEINRTKAGGGKIEYITRQELNLLREEHDNLCVKMMLIFMALERRGLISESDLEEIAAEIREGKLKEPNNVGKDDTDKAKRPRRRRRKTEEVDEDLSESRFSVPSTRGRVRVRLRPKKTGETGAS